MLKMDQLKNLHADELEEKLSQLKKELMQFRFQAKTGKLERQSVIKNTKRDIARVLTVINEKERNKVST